jgi:two-component system invasion response regulator UvrY
MQVLSFSALVQQMRAPGQLGGAHRTGGHWRAGVGQQPVEQVGVLVAAENHAWTAARAIAPPIPPRVGEGRNAFGIFWFAQRWACQSNMLVRAEKAIQGAPMNILIVDDHEVVREGLERVLARSGEPWAVTAVADAFKALEVLARDPIDIAVVDLTLPGMEGLELIKRIHSRFPKVAVLVLSMHVEEANAVRAFRAGARGYVTKDSASDELVVAIRHIAAGGVHVTPVIAASMVMQLYGGQAAPRHSRLSDRELEVARRLVGGQRPSDIAEALHLSVKTVSTHKSRILDKLELSSLASLVRYGIEHGLAADSGPTHDRPPDDDDSP